MDPHDGRGSTASAWKDTQVTADAWAQGEDSNAPGRASGRCLVSVHEYEFTVVAFASKLEAAKAQAWLDEREAGIRVHPHGRFNGPDGVVRRRDGSVVEDGSEEHVRIMAIVGAELAEVAR